MDFMEKYAAYEDTYIKSASLWDSYVNNLAGRSDERDKLQEEYDKHSRSAKSYTVLRRNADAASLSYLNEAKSSISRKDSKDAMPSFQMGTYLSEASKDYKGRAEEDTKAADEAKSKRNLINLQVGATRLGTGLAGAGIIRSASKLLKHASLATASKIVKGVGSTLKSGAGNAAGTVGFSAVGAGLNQTPKQSNNFNPPESEG